MPLGLEVSELVWGLPVSNSGVVLLVLEWPSWGWGVFSMLEGCFLYFGVVF